MTNQTNKTYVLWLSRFDHVIKIKRSLVHATALVVVIAGALAFSTAAVAAGTASSTVTIKGENGDYHGRVQSSSRYCEANRTVSVYKMVGSKPKPSQDKRVGSDTTENDGKWDAGNTGYKHGKFYARVSRSEIARPATKAAPSVCRPATSEVLKR